MLHPAIVLRDADTIEGHGLIATAPITKGEVVSRLEPDQPKMLIRDLLLLSPAEQDAALHFCYQCDSDYLVCEDGIEKYTNHSCDPNTWWIDSDTMVARRDIQAGEEITYDYATTEVDVPLEMACLCGAPTCRGVVRNTDHLNPDWQAIYGEYLPRHTKQAIARAKAFPENK